MYGFCFLKDLRGPLKSRSELLRILFDLCLRFLKVMLVNMKTYSSNRRPNRLVKISTIVLFLDVPIGLLKSQRLGIQNVVMEIDLVYHGIDYKVFNARAMCELLLKRLQWIYVNLSFDSQVIFPLEEIQPNGTTILGNDLNISLFQPS